MLSSYRGRVEGPILARHLEIHQLECHSTAHPKPTKEISSLTLGVLITCLAAHSRYNTCDFIIWCTLSTSLLDI